MKQYDLWHSKYYEIMDFMMKNHRSPSKHYLEAKQKHNRIHHNRKMMNKGKMKPGMVKLFRKLLALVEEYKHVNQYA